MGLKLCELASAARCGQDEGSHNLKLSFLTMLGLYLVDKED